MGVNGIFNSEDTLLWIAIIIAFVLIWCGCYSENSGCGC